MTSKTNSFVSFLPAPGWILLDPYEENTGSFSYVADDKKTLKKGTVVNIGPDYNNEFGSFIACPVKKGDIISHQTIGYEEVKIDNHVYRVVPFIKIIGIWSDRKLN